MLKLKLLLCFIILFHTVYSQNFTVSGYVQDINTGERIIGAFVIDSISKQSVQTNNFGFFSLKSKRPESAIQATYMGLSSKFIHLSLVHDTLINIKMNSIRALSEVVVTSSRYDQDVNTPLGFKMIPITQLKLMPAIGEPDLLKSIQNQPGIKGGVEGSSGIFVRGGGSGENLFLLDDVPIYNVSHFYGFFSAFNTSAVKDLKLLKGCFPARYGGRTSSVIDIRSRDGNNQTLKGEASVGFVAANLMFEGPLFSDKTTFMISGRRSWLDSYSEVLKKLDLLGNDFPKYNFYDFNSRITHTFSAKDRIFLNFYMGKDHILNPDNISEMANTSGIFSDNRDQSSGWGNLISSIRWNHTFGNDIFANTTIGYSSYNYFTGNKYHGKDSTRDLEKKYSSGYNSDIYDVILKTDFDYSISNKHRMMFGAGNTFHTFNPGKTIYNMYDQELKTKIDTTFSNGILQANELYLYAEDEFQATQKLSFNVGLRLSGLISERDRSFNTEPRVSLNYSVLPNFCIKGGYSKMVQYMHLLSRSGLTMPTDIWVPALKGLKPLKSDQINAGIAFDVAKKILISAEIYNKSLVNTTDFRNGSSLLTDLSPWYEKTTQGKGSSKGIEISIEKQRGRLTGSINYTRSTADRTYADLNNGESFPFKYDRLNDFNISGNFQISKKWDISAMWVYGTGYPVTIPIERYLTLLGFQGTERREIFYYPSLNNVRLPDYHRLDLAFHHKKQTRWGERIISIDIFNAYDYRNPVNVYYDLGIGEFLYNYFLPLIPSVTYTMKF